MEEKLCIDCNKNKNINEFEFRADTNKYRNQCKECIAIKQKINSKNHYEINKEKINLKRQQFKIENKGYVNTRQKIYNKKHREKKNIEKNIKKYEKQIEENNLFNLNLKQCINCKQIKNINEFEFRKDINKYRGQCFECYKFLRNKQINQRRKNNINIKLRANISNSINKCINKNGKSITKYLPYTIEQLKIHLESLFEPWMNWENYGQYKTNEWLNESQSTWVWNIDHIIPQSKLLYDSMEHPNFQKCWALSNLRPYSAKQNIIDGNRREDIDIAV